jgi:D-3-phosphoglycerate dehydrogenase
MKVLVADQFSEDGIKEMQNAGIEVIYDHALNGESLTRALAEIQPNVLVVRSTKVTAENINADPKL